MTHLICRIGLMALLGSAVAAPAAAQESVREEFTAFAVNMNVGAANVVQIVVDKYSPDGDREALLKAFMDKGQDELLKELLKRPRLGYIRLPNTLGHDNHFATQGPLPEGGRRVIVITDRPISNIEARNQTRSMDYPFTMLEIHFDKAGVGTGKMSTATEIVKSKDGRHLELDIWQNQPTMFTQVKVKDKVVKK
jgi:hypothetical protein